MTLSRAASLLRRVAVCCVTLTPWHVSALADDADRLAEYQRAGLSLPGNVERGAAFFQDANRTKCALCHKIGGVGGAVGPDLTAIGGKFDRPHLIESLLEPSRQIVEGYRTTTIATVNGEVLTGIVREESPDGLVLLDALNNRHELSTEEIEDRRSSTVSLMPTGLADALSVSEFADLLAYLETLRTRGDTPGSATVGPFALHQGFAARTIATSLTGAVAMETTRDGRVLLCEQTGALRVLRDGQLLAEPLVKLRVNSDWERGLIGVTIDPNFPQTPHVYVCYVAAEPYTHHVISRFAAEGDIAVPGSEVVLLAGDNQSALGGNVPAGHQGGAVHFGPDGKLYIAIGDQTAGAPAQRLDTLQGKLLRINPDGSIPEDNPFAQQAVGKYRSIWALGLRNPFTFAFDPRHGRPWINDVGGEFEEINIGVAGGNYGWPTVEHGRKHDPRFVDPIHQYPQASISGAAFVPDDSSWPALWRGRFLFADFVHGWIHALDPDRSDDVLTLATGLRRPVDLRFGSDGQLYVLIRNAWVIDGKFEAGTSSLVEIRHVSQ